MPHHGSVQHSQVADAIVTAAEPVDWGGNGGRDLLLSAWDACYGAKVRLFRETGDFADGTPNLAYRGAVEGVSGLVSVVPDRDIFHLLSTSRSRRSLALYVNVGVPGAPRFAAPVTLELEVDWLRQ